MEGVLLEDLKYRIFCHRRVGAMDDSDDDEFENMLHGMFLECNDVRQASAAQQEQDDLEQNLFAEIVGVNRVQSAPPAAPAAAGGDEQCAEEQPQQLSLSHWFGDPAWLNNFGNDLQKGLFDRFTKFSSKHLALPDAFVDPDRSSSGKSGYMTDTVLKSFVQEATVKSIAVVAEVSGTSKKGVGASLRRTACVMVYGCGFLTGCFLSGWRRLFRTSRFEPVAFISKMLYDETPLKMKLQEWNKFMGQDEILGKESSLKESYKYAKILRLDWQLGFIVMDRAVGKHKLITIPLVVPLLAIDRNTPECLLGAIDRVHALVPELAAFQEEFGIQIRMPVIDRFSSNLKMEKFINSRNPKLTTNMYLCDVHKESSCIKNAMALTDNTLSGVINIALALEGSGSLDRLRGILQQVFSEELVVSFAQPPGHGSEEFRHRQAVLDTFLPLMKEGASRLITKKRRFILQSLANSDLSSHQIVHHCSFSCCRSPEESLKNFQKYLVWALLPHKLNTFNRKSWTGSDVAIHWCGLLASHWQLLPKLIMRFVMVDKPLHVHGHGALDGLEDEMAGSFVPRLEAGAGDANDEMDALADLFQA